MAFNPLVASLPTHPTHPQPTQSGKKKKKSKKISQSSRSFHTAPDFLCFFLSRLPSFTSLSTTNSF
jgi:hypothetical protein